MTKVIFTDGAEKDFSEGTFLDALLEHDKSVVNKTIAVRANGLLVDLKSPLDAFDGSVTVEPITAESPEGLSILRHSTAHVLAQAVKSLFDGVKVTIGPTIDDGFYYDFDVAEPFTPEDLKKIEKRMKELIKKKFEIKREMISRTDAIKLFTDAGENYKVELLEEIEDEQVSLYRQDDFVDLCRGPHLPSTGRIKAFKLLSSAGAYWRGSEKNPMLQRIYGTAFATKDDLKAHLERLEEAKKRDHRKIGKELDLFTTSEDIGAGLVLWHPKGSVVRTSIEDFWRKEHVKHDYGLVYTPHIALLELWKKSGHWDFYQENLFSPMDVDGRDYIVRPMNCPFHIDIYKTRLKSYRDL
ncbi:MAG: threonine--tRNA ligase, partial [Proteobacteria bacterium]|nr:threonine--tRNA ligase [Pseudomonadota bacterium]